ncbi:MAG: hypothetical protein WAO07_16745 [Desulfobacterales bacterium]
MFKRPILYTALFMVLTIGVGCGQNEGGHEARPFVSGNGNSHITADDMRCQDTLAMLNKTGFDASVIFAAKEGDIETTIEKCVDWFITGSFGDK